MKPSPFALLALVSLVAAPAPARELVALDGRTWTVERLEQQPGRLVLHTDEGSVVIANREVDYRETFERSLPLDDGLVLAFRSGASLRCASAALDDGRVRVVLESGGELAFPPRTIDFRRTIRESFSDASSQAQVEEQAVGGGGPRSSERSGGEASEPAEDDRPAQEVQRTAAPAPPGNPERPQTWVVTATLAERKPLSLLFVEIEYPEGCQVISPTRPPGFLRFGSSLPGEVEVGLPGREPLRVGGRAPDGSMAKGPGRILRALFRCQGVPEDELFFELGDVEAESFSTGERMQVEVKLAIAKR